MKGPSSILTDLGWKIWKTGDPKIQKRARYFLSRGSYRLSSRDRGKSWKLYNTLPPLRELLAFKVEGKPTERIRRAQIIGNAVILDPDGVIQGAFTPNQLLKWAKDQLR